MIGRDAGAWKRFIAAGLCGMGLASCGPALESSADDEVPVAGRRALTEGAALTAHDASCLRMQDQDTWSSAVSFMAPGLFALFVGLSGDTRLGILGIVLILLVGLVLMLPVKAQQAQID